MELPHEASEAPVKAGYLFKRPVHRSFGDVQKRWITLHDDAVDWRKQPAEAPLGKLSMQGATLLAGGVEVRIRSGTLELSLLAENEDEAAAWAAAVGDRFGLDIGVLDDAPLYEDDCCGITRDAICISWYWFPTAATKTVPFPDIQEARGRPTALGSAQLWCPCRTPRCLAAARRWSCSRSTSRAS